MLYTWDIIKLHTEEKNDQNFVVRVDWRLTATDDDVVIVRDGIEYFEQPDGDFPNNFVEFNALTKDTVLSWILNRVNKNTEENAIFNRIQNKKQQTTKETLLPWSVES